MAPNRAIRLPKKRLMTADVMNRQLSLRAYRLRGMPVASLIAARYRDFVLLQKPSVTNTIRKQAAMTAHLRFDPRKNFCTVNTFQDIKTD